MLIVMHFTKTNFFLSNPDWNTNTNKQYHFQCHKSKIGQCVWLAYYEHVRQYHNVSHNVGCFVPTKPQEPGVVTECVGHLGQPDWCWPDPSPGLAQACVLPQLARYVPVALVLNQPQGLALVKLLEDCPQFANFCSKGYIGRIFGKVNFSSP